MGDQGSPDLSIIVVNWNTRDLLAKCLASIYETVRDTSFELWVVDNASTDGSAEMVRERFPQVQLIVNQENVGFVRANNQALERCAGRYILLMNSDAEALPGSIDEAVRFMETHPRAGIAGARLLNPDGSFQASYADFPTLWGEFLILSTLGRRLHRPTYPSHGPELERGRQRIAGYVSGAFLLLRRQALDQVGPLDENIYMYAEEVDWCYRCHHSSWELWYLPDVVVLHHGGQSTRQLGSRMEAELYRSRLYYFAKHRGRVAAWALAGLIWSFTTPKILLHAALKIATHGHRGRAVTRWRELARAVLSALAATQGAPRR